MCFDTVKGFVLGPQAVSEHQGLEIYWFEHSAAWSEASPYKEHVETQMGGCQNCGPFLGTLNNRCRIMIVTQKVTIILTTLASPTPETRNPLNELGFRV